MTKVPSFTFAGGVLSKALWGRYDLNKYQTGLKKAENCVISVEGGVEKRFGTYYTGQRKDQSSGARLAKLIPWRIADDDSYMLEFGENYIRFIRFGGYVTIPGSHVPDPDSIAVNVDGFMEVATPYTADAAWELKYTFANDIMYISHESERPQMLQRLGLYDWNFIEQDFNPHPDWSGAITATYHDDTTVDDNYDAEPIQHRYKVSALLADGIETKPSPAQGVAADMGHRRTRVELDWPNYPDALGYTIYTGANGVFGFIGYSENSDFTDRNYAPSYDIVPVGNRIGFGTGQNTRVIEFYKQRMVYASTPNRPQDLWLSRPLIFNSLTESVPLQDDDAFRLSLVGRNRHTINHMLMMKKFLIFTDSAEWTLETVENRAMSAATADPIIQTYYGAHPWLRPQAISNRVLFVQNKTGDVLDMGYDFSSDALQADNLSRLVRDLFKGKEIVAWDYALHPQSLMFCVMDDGTVNVMTYVREHEIWGWTTHSTNGKFIDVACITEIDHEGVYFQVEREIDGETVYFVERLEVNFTNRIEDMVYMDCALSYSAAYAAEITYGEDELEAAGLSIVGLDVGDLVRLEFSEEEFYVCEVSGIGADLKLIPTWSTPAIFPETASGSATLYVMATSFTGYEHLEGEEVWVLADGKVYKNITIATGGFNLPKAAARVHVGLAYDNRIETLDMDDERAKGRFMHKTVHEITLNLRDSRGVFIGVPGYDLERLLPRNSETNMYDANAVLDGPFELSPHITWDNTTEIIIESRDPLPLNVLNIAPDIRYG